MKRSKDVGFTIVETVLFLGITALLIMGIMVGTGNSINIQRYRDSVSSLKSVFQQQYSDVSNVSNDRLSTDLPCGSATGVPLGQSNCVIFGKYITPANNGKTLNIFNVVGQIPSSLSFNDITDLRNSNLTLSSRNDYEIEWGASVANFSGGNGNFSILIVRSPTSGAVRTFVDPFNILPGSNIVQLVNLTALSETVTMCINSNGLFNGNRYAIVLKPNASSTSGIESIGDASGC